MSALVVRRQCVYSFGMFVDKWCALTTILMCVNVCSQIGENLSSTSCVRKGTDFVVLDEIYGFGHKAWSQARIFRLGKNGQANGEVHGS